MALTLKAGSTYTLTHPDGLGQGVGALPTGTEVTVEGLLKEPVAGVGGEVVFTVREDAVNDEGEPVEAYRVCAMSLDGFKQMFAKAGGK